ERDLVLQVASDRAGVREPLLAERAGILAAGARDGALLALDDAPQKGATRLRVSALLRRHSVPRTQPDAPPSTRRTGVGRFKESHWSFHSERSNDSLEVIFCGTVCDIV